MINDIITLINQPVTMGAGTVVAVLVLSVRVKRNEKDIDCIKKQCITRLEQCLKRFKIIQ